MLGGDWPDAGLNEKLWLDGSLDIGGRKLGGGFSDMRAADEDALDWDTLGGLRRVRKNRDTERVVWHRGWDAFLAKAGRDD